MSSAPHGTILVTGGTGKVGLILTKLLEAASIPFLAASRFSSGVVHGVRFDWLDRDTWDEVFAATTTKDQPPVIAVFLIAPSVVESSPIMNDFVDLARDKYGVKRFVLLSATVIEAGGMAMGGTAGYLAELGEKGEIEWGIMRPTWFQDNWAEQDNLHKSIKAEGKCYSAAGDGKIPWVSKHDIAACAFCALTAEKPVNGDLIILGPELLSHSDCAAVLTEVTGKEIAHVNLSAEELVVHHSETLGLPEQYGKMLADMDTIVKNGGEERTNDVVLRVTGRAPKTFRKFAEENKALWI